jgi:uncharacterized surface protein with fasciclin (FAS1) repeats
MSSSATPSTAVSRRPRGRAARVAAMVAAAAILGAAPASAGNLIQELRREGRFGTLLTALQVTGLTAAVRDCTSCTLFAPNDHAFARLPKELLAGLLKLAARGKLAAILTYHVVASPIPAGAVPTTATLVQTINPSEAKLLALRQHGRVTVNGVRVLEADIQASGSVIHEVRDVLWPGEFR